MPTHYERPRDRYLRKMNHFSGGTSVSMKSSDDKTISIFKKILYETESLRGNGQAHAWLLVELAMLQPYDMQPYEDLKRVCEDESFSW